MNVLEKNLSVLRERGFSITDYIRFEYTYNNNNNLKDFNLKTAETGDYTLILKGINLYGASNPKRIAKIRAKKLLKNLPKHHALIIIVGFGIGYELKEILKKTPRKYNFVIIENPDFFSNLIKEVDISTIMNDERLIDIIPNSKVHIREFLEMFEDYIISNNYEVFTIEDNLYGDILKNLYENIITIYINNYSMYRLSNDIALNLSSNYEKFLRSPGVKLLKERFNIPVLVISAGPSLINDLETIRIIQDRVILVSIAAALKPLLNHDIYPDFVLHIDPLDIGYEKYLRGVKIPENIYLVLGDSSNKLFFNHDGAKYFVFNAVMGGYFYKKFSEFLPDKGKFFPGESVAIAAFSFALYITKPSLPVILVGQDLSYPLKGKTHVEGSGSDKDIEIKKGDSKYVWIKGNYVDFVPSNSVFITFRNSFSVIAEIEKKKGRTLINATSGGAYIDGFELCKLKSERVKNIIPDKLKLDKKKVINEIYDSYEFDVDIETLYESCKNVKDTVQETLKTLYETNKIEHNDRWSRLIKLIKDKEKKEILLAALEVSGLEFDIFDVYVKLVRSKDSSLLKILSEKMFDELIDALENKIIRNVEICCYKLEELNMNINGGSKK